MNLFGISLHGYFENDSRWSQSWPDQPSWQLHSSGLLQVPSLQPALGWHWSQIHPDLEQIFFAFINLGSGGEIVTCVTERPWV